MARAPAGHMLGLRQEAEELAGRLPPLQVGAERIAQTVAQGVHGRRQVGVGETFWQFRPYYPGDPAASIDWRQSARTASVFLREQEWEAALSVWLWADPSPSMAYRSGPRVPTKGERAITLMLALASLLLRGGERVAVLGSGLRPQGGRHAQEALARALAAARAPEDGLPPAAQLPRHGRLVLLSDFLVPLDALAERLRSYVAMGVHGHLLQVLDPAEETLPFAGRVLFEGTEGEGTALIGSVDNVRGRYGELLAAHRDGLLAQARRFGWTFAVHRSDRPPETPLLTLYQALAARGYR
jgi:uncharacterized protein (DUF58 family)